MKTRTREFIHLSLRFSTIYLKSFQLSLKRKNYLFYKKCHHPVIYIYILYISKRNIPISRSRGVFLSVKNYYPNYLNYRGPRVFSCTNPWLNEADTQWEREREREIPFTLYSRSIFTKVGWKGTKRGGGTQRERGRKKSISSTRALWQRDYHGMHATHHYFRLYRFCIFFFFFLFAPLTRLDDALYARSWKMNHSTLFS